MKKAGLIAIAVIFCIEANAQFFRGVELFVAGNSSMQRYRNFNTKDIQRGDPNFLSAGNEYYVDNHHSHDLQSFGFGLVAEFLRYDYVRWQTELEYTHKGGIEHDYDWIHDVKGPATANLWTQIQWNNYLKYFLPEGNKGQPYIMLGARLEYNLSSAVTAYVPVAGLRPKIWFSGDVAVGYEFFTWKRFHPFVEFHWNPDVMYQPPVAGSTMRNRTYELRVGIMYRPMRRGIDDCNAPKYHGNYY